MFHGETMIVSGRSMLVAGVAVATAAAVVLAPATQLNRAAAPATQLTTAWLPMDPDLLVSPAAASSIGTAIESLYLDLEPWARYGANLTSWAVGWVPFAGLLAPQINFSYDLDEAITRSLLFNTVDLLDGTIGFDQALGNIGSDTATAFNTFVNTQVNWVQHLLPPLPPLPSPPPLPPLAEAVPALDPVAQLDADGLTDADPGLLPDLDATLSLVS